MPQLLSAVVKLTTDCPCNCSCCSNRQKQFKNKSTSRVISLSEFDAICRIVQELGGKYICISGGEPTLLNTITEYIFIASAYGIIVRLNTNGYRIKYDRLNQWLDAGLRQVVISIHGSNQETVFNLRKNRHLYFRSLDALDALGRAKKQRNFILIVQTVLMRENYTQMPLIFELAIKSGADLFWPSYLEDAVHLDSLRMTKEDIDLFRAKTIPEWVSIAERYNVANSKMIAEINNIYKDDYSQGLYHLKPTSCSRIGRHLTFYPGGRIDPCIGHEYFCSQDQLSVNLFDSNCSSVLQHYLMQMEEHSYPYCSYCPQNVHQAVFIKPEFDEYESSK